jgi:3-oxoacyl-[acyl-carrier-protein] synthase II
MTPNLDPRLNFTFWKPQSKTVRAALSNTFGFGGHNACVIVRQTVRLHEPHGGEN